MLARRAQQLTLLFIRLGFAAMILWGILASSTH